jgi:hypothetical protein
MSEPLPVTSLIVWDFRQSARPHAFRPICDRTTGFPETEAEAMVAKFSSRIETRDIFLGLCNLAAAPVRAEELSRRRTVSGGHRSFDLLHAAAALELGGTMFLYFDGNQNRLAKSEGFATPLAVRTGKR